MFRMIMILLSIKGKLLSNRCLLMILIGLFSPLRISFGSVVDWL